MLFRGLISCKNICNERGFTIGYETITSKTYIITKIPVILLIYIMRHDYDNCNIVQDIKGAQVRLCAWLAGFGLRALSNKNSFVFVDQEKAVRTFHSVGVLRTIW